MRPHRPAILVVAASIALVAAAARVRADGAAQPPSVSTSLDVTPQDQDPSYGYFSIGEPRFFLSTRSEAGLVYARPHLAAGYGQPHWLWGGFEANAILTPEFVQAFAGLRLASPVADLSFGVRDTLSFVRPFLSPAASYSQSAVESTPGDGARYLAYEGEVVGVLPLPHAALVADFVFVRTLDVPHGRYVYDESYRAIVAKPLFTALRVAAVARLLTGNALSAGGLVEYVSSTGRSEGVIRVGPAAALRLTDHLDAVAVVTFAVSSPDRLGLVMGAFGVAGLRYRWATGEAEPAWPWEGP